MQPTTQYNRRCNLSRFVFIAFQLVPIQVSILIDDVRICIIVRLDTSKKHVELVPICAVHEMSCHCSHIHSSLFFLSCLMSISDVNSSQPHFEIGSISDIIFKGVMSPVGSVNASYFQYLVNQSQTEMGVSVNNVANPDVKLLKGMHRHLNTHFMVN